MTFGEALQEWYQRPLDPEEAAAVHVLSLVDVELALALIVQLRLSGDEALSN